MTNLAIPKPEVARKVPKGLKRKTPLRARTFLKDGPQDQGTEKKKRRRKPYKPKLIPAKVMDAVEKRSQGYDEIDGYLGANQGHHIKHRSQGGLDIPINILHVSSRNHPYKLHEDRETIEKAHKILEDRIEALFPDDRYYTLSDLKYKLGLPMEYIEKQISKGNLKSNFTQLGWIVSKEEIKRWLMP